MTDEFKIPVHLNSHGLKSEKNINSAGMGCHFCFGNSRTFEFGDSVKNLELHHFTHLVRFNVRPQSFGRSCNPDHSPDVLFYSLRIYKERGRRQITNILYVVPVLHGMDQYSSNEASTSTAIFIGRNMPTALR